MLAFTTPQRGIIHRKKKLFYTFTQILSSIFPVYAEIPVVRGRPRWDQQSVAALVVGYFRKLRLTNTVRLLALYIFLINKDCQPANVSVVEGNVRSIFMQQNLKLTA